MCTVCPQNILQTRLLNRAKVSSRLDDGVIIMQKRFETFRQTTMPVISYYKERNKVIQVDASQDAATVYKDIQAAARDILENLAKTRVVIEDNSSR